MKKQANREGSEDGSVETPSIEALQQQIENLNKGIATYRDDARRAQDEAQEAKSEAESIKSKLADLERSFENSNKGSGDGLPELSSEDQRRLEAWAKSRGFVTKSEVESERQRMQTENIRNIENQAISDFLKEYPEYDKDENWQKLKEEFGLYKQPTTLADYRKLLAKVHKQLNPSQDAVAKARAEIEMKKRLGYGGGSQKATDGEMTAEKLREKYPRLSAEQIQSRLAEINRLYPEKKK